MTRALVITFLDSVDKKKHENPYDPSIVHGKEMSLSKRGHLLGEFTGSSLRSNSPGAVRDGAKFANLGAEEGTFIVLNPTKSMEEFCKHGLTFVRSAKIYDISDQDAEHYSEIADVQAREREAAAAKPVKDQKAFGQDTFYGVQTIIPG